MKIHYYDILSKKKITSKVVKQRAKIGLKYTTGVYMGYEDYIKLKNGIKNEK